MRTVGLLYVTYFALSIAGTAFRNVPLQLVATAFYFVLTVFLYQLFGPADPRIALALFPLAALGCLVQGLGQATGDIGLLRAALVPFALFLVVLGYLIGRSTFAPRELGVLVAAAGIVWPITVIPGVPGLFVAAAVLLGIVAEVVLALWLVVAA